MLYAVCKPQADERGVSDEEFGRSMAGDAIESATVALLEDIVGFCPSPRDRAALGRVLTAMRNARDKARDLVDKNLDRMIEGGEIDRIVESAMTEAETKLETGLERATSGGSSTGAPASPGSIRTP